MSAAIWCEVSNMEPEKDNEDTVKLEWTDIVAMAIAQFEILMPMIIVIAAAFLLVLWIFT